MKLNLRDYQTAAVEGLYQYWADGRGENPIIVAPTGAGKSLILAKLIEDAMSFPGTRVLVLTHVKELLIQNAQELASFYPEAEFGFYSASIGQKRLDKPITFAGIQSVWQKAYDFVPAPDLVLIDEAHLVPKNATTRYGKFLADLRVCNPEIKIVGLTATHYRLDSGYLHKGEGALFDGIAYDIPVGMLMDKGHLCQVVSKGSVHKIDLSNVHMRGGEFIEAELAVAASDPALVQATVAEIVEYGKERKAWLVFASGVGHADMLRQEFEGHGVPCGVITGETSDRDKIIADFKAQRLRCLIGVNVLTTGFNVPAVDLVAIVRATASTGLYVQIVGRGTRNAPGKTDCLVLDYGQNVERHGFIDAVKPKDKTKSDGGGEAPAKECPECQEMLHTAIRICPKCSYEFPPPELNHASRAYGGAILSSQVQAEWVDVEGVSYSKWKKEGKPDSIRVTYSCGMMSHSEWLCPDHGGYAASRYKARMPALKATALTTDDAIQESSKWSKPGRIKIKPQKDSKFFEIVQLDYSEREVELSLEDEIEF